MKKPFHSQSLSPCTRPASRYRFIPRNNTFCQRAPPPKKTPVRHRSPDDGGRVIRPGARDLLMCPATDNCIACTLEKKKKKENIPGGGDAQYCAGEATGKKTK